MHKPQVRRTGPLETVIVDGGPEPDRLVVLCHGFGAPGDDLVPLATEWLRQLEAEAGRFRFAFPSGPISLADQGLPDGRAWWPLNMLRLMELVDTHRWDEIRNEQPPGLDIARGQLQEAVDRMLDELGLHTDRLVLGGFSQGAMLALDTAVRGGATPPAGLLQFSGTLICESEWRAAGGRLAGVPVVQTHGRRDPILPFEAAEWLRALLESSGAEVNWMPFDGPHTIPARAIGTTVELLGSLPH